MESRLMDPLTLLVTACVIWGVYRKFLKPLVDPYIAAYLGEAPTQITRRGWVVPDLSDAVPKRWASSQSTIRLAPTVKDSPKRAVISDAEARVREALEALPSLVRFEDMKVPYRQPLSVPLGVAAFEGSKLLDFGDETLNVAVYGTSGSGKDTLIMGWFITLALRNSPDDVQFLVLDGKGHWLTPNLKGLAHMYTDPCGGYGERGNEIIEEGLELIDAEAGRRSELIFGGGYRSREQYIAGTGEKLPMIVILITDGMDSIQGLIEAMLISLASKGRALGFKVVVSMSTPTKRDMRWRINLSTVLSGPLVDRSQNAVALGLPTDYITYPPSLLPDPRKRHGTFVARIGSGQYLIQAPYITDQEFDEIVDTLPRRAHPAPEVPEAFARALAGKSSKRQGSPSEFIEECIAKAPGRKVPGGVLYEAYTEWCARAEKQPLNQTAFGTAAGRILSKSRSGRGVVMYEDVELIEDVE